MKKKVIFFNTHPIQYFAPLYAEINKDKFFDLEVWYGTRHGLGGEIDKQFGTNVKWDIPILEGYKYKFLKNYALNPGLYNGFFGVVNLGIWTELRKLPKKSIIIVHGWKPFSAIFALLCSKILGHVTCLRAESPLIHEEGRSKRSIFLRKLFFKHFLFKRVDKFLFIGEQNRLFYEFYGVSTSKLIFIPYAVNNEYFHNEYENLIQKKEYLKQKSQIPIHQQVILFSGKFIDKKRPLDLINAYDLLENKNNITLILMGEGELRVELEKEIINKDLKNVVITGFINQTKISDYYIMADIFVMCSDYGETWGLSTNEAMNFHLPIIISDRTGNFSDLVKNNGFVFKTGDIIDLKNKIEKVLSTSNNERIKMAISSKKIVDTYSYQTIIKNLKIISEA